MTDRDHDVEDIVRILEKEEYFDERRWNTPLLRDIETGEHFVIRNIYIDEDDDVIFDIAHL